MLILPSCRAHWIVVTPIVMTPAGIPTNNTAVNLDYCLYQPDSHQQQNYLLRQHGAIVGIL